MSSIEVKPFGQLPDGRIVERYELSNANGIRIAILNYGGIIQSIQTPDRSGNMADVVLGFDDLNGYLNDTAYHGALVGRYANRICGGKFALQGRTYDLSINDGENCLHGGAQGFNRELWKARIRHENFHDVLNLTHVSPDGAQGFPGALTVEAHYWLSEQNEFKVQFTARSDKPTYASLTLHPYFNFSGDSRETIMNHELTLHADQYVPVDALLKPLGPTLSVVGTPFDFRKRISISERMEGSIAGYDHCFVRRERGSTASLMAEVVHASSGRRMSLSSNAPGCQVYTGNFLELATSGKQGRHFRPQGGLCLEPQEFPNAPNEPFLPISILNPGETYDHIIIFKFSTGTDA